MVPNCKFILTVEWTFQAIISSTDFWRWLCYLNFNYEVITVDMLIRH